MTRAPPRRPGSRSGYTTGSTAAAAAKAATLALLAGCWPQQVTITLPIGERATMTPLPRTLTSEQASCCVVKDAGDDPDVTHGALICAEVSYSSRPGIQLDGGEGVGRVTLPGLGLEVGSAAINPVPRQQIVANVMDAIRQICTTEEAFLQEQGLEICISVPEGERLAQKTMNARLGIVGGISILGTTGKVLPYSTDAWQASVIQAVEVAAANGAPQVALTTGARTERAALQMLPHLPAVAFVLVGDFVGDALQTCVVQHIPAASLVCMIGKLIKIAQGHLATHVSHSQLEIDFLVQVCQDMASPTGLAAEVGTAITGRRFLEICQAWDFLQPVHRVTERAWESCQHWVAACGGTMKIDVVLIDFDGSVLSSSRAGQQ